MRFALLLEALHPRPWAPTGDGRRLRELVDVAVRAEGLGFARVWVPERHFQEELQHAGPPEVVLGAIATRTRRLGLGLGPVGAHPRIQHPARLAAVVAALDALSAGRAAVAFAEPRAAIELGPFRIARAGTRAAADRTIELVARLLAEEPFSGEDAERSGEGEGLPVRQLVPRPQTRPHPALWRACDRPDDVRAAAESGLGAFVRAPLEPAEAAEWVAEHRAVQRSARCQPLGAAIETGVAIALPVHVAADAATALAEGLDAVHLHRHLTDHHERFGAHRPGRTRAAEEFARRRTETGLDPAPILAAPDGPLALRVGGSLRGAVGDPEQVAALLAAYRDAGVDEVVLVPPLGLLDPAILVRSLELLGARVLPGLDDDEDEDDVVEAEDPDLRAALGRRRPVPVEQETVVLPRQDGVLDDVPAPPIGVGTVSGAVGGGTAGPPGDGSGAPPTGGENGAGRPGGAVAAGGSGHATGGGRGPGGAGRGPGGAGPAGVRAAIGRRGGAALGNVLDRGSSGIVRRTLASDPALRVVFGGMARALRPAARSGEFRGELQFELVEADGQVAPWTVEAGPLRALARRGPAREPTLTLRLTRDDLLRLVSGRLDAGGAVLDGRLDLEGDLALAVRMGDLFRR
ncbi:LLM class flavin-dependent oxidoreductase [Patulibacter americanus]|uniref:LLM class flavin-dependent oxidoreductase n=1 Tax=Patulibacter americanus TaxID=588672 RepID=UPI0003B6EF6D|nr:LLM class flavin-dependent oxidoreductase [Patulibacter americanus]